MQLFNGKSKLFGVLLVLAAFFSFYLGDITTLTPPQKATAGVALVILVLLALIFALRPKKTEEDLIAGRKKSIHRVKMCRESLSGCATCIIYDNYRWHDCLRPDSGICLYLAGYGRYFTLWGIENCLYRFCIPLR